MKNGFIEFANNLLPPSKQIKKRRTAPANILVIGATNRAGDLDRQTGGDRRRHRAPERVADQMRRTDAQIGQGLFDMDHQILEPFGGDFERGAMAGQID